jgi:phage shock protein PspC (stress-responsive transcriptional regulator)
MNKVTIINLNGKAFQIEEAAFEILHSYLENALLKLRDNPDKEEIRLDLEQAIAEKCKKFLTPHKTVITEAEIRTIVAEMGPIEETPEAASNESSEKKDDSGTPKRLYNIREGAKIAGVCNGIAAYFDLDVTLVRVVFVILTLITHGGFVFVYVLMMIFVPYAHTSEQKARAYGLPFTAQELIDNTKKSYQGFRAHKHDWKNEKREWKQTHKESVHRWKHERRHGALEEIWSLLGIVAWILVISFGLWYGYQRFPLVHNFLDDAHTEYTHVIDSVSKN